MTQTVPSIYRPVKGDKGKGYTKSMVAPCPSTCFSCLISRHRIITGTVVSRKAKGREYYKFYSMSHFFFIALHTWRRLFALFSRSIIGNDEACIFFPLYPIERIKTAHSWLEWCNIFFVGKSLPVKKKKIKLWKRCALLSIERSI